MNEKSRRIVVPLFFWAAVVANTAFVLPATGVEPGRLDDFFRWNASHVKGLVDPLANWGGIGRGWWMFAHHYVASHDWYDTVDEIDVTDASGVTHAYQIPPAGMTFWQRVFHARMVCFKCGWVSPPTIRNIMLWYVRKDATLDKGRRPPFKVICYNVSRVINPPGSPATFGPFGKWPRDTAVVGWDDIRCQEAWPSYDF
jgi:hypothetical protein